MVICAFDVSLTSPGFAVAKDGAVVQSGTLPPKRTEGDHRLIELRSKVMDKIEEHGAGLVLFEDLTYGTADGKAFERAGLLFSIRMECTSDGLPYVLVNAATLKKFVVGRGSSKGNPVTKDLIIKEIFKQFGHDVNQNDQADAIGLAYVGMALAGEWEPRNEAQRDSIAKIRAYDMNKHRLRNIAAAQPATQQPSGVRGAGVELV